MDHIPVATTYDELQALHVIHEVFQSLDVLADDSDRAISIFLFCIEAILENAAHLQETCLHELNREVPDKMFVSQRGIWTRDILYLAIELAHCIRRESSQSATEANEWPQMMRFMKVKERADSRLLESLPSGESMQSILYASTQLNPTLNIVQNWKTINQLLFLLNAQVTSIAFSEEVLRIVRTESVTRCVNEGINPADRTFLRQFRLLHQIPELVGRELMKYVQRVADSDSEKRPPELVLAELERCNVFLRLMISSTIPLANELTPNSYYEIRSRLGITSGSQSRVIAQQILSPSTAKCIIDFAKRIEKQRTRSERSRILRHQTLRSLAKSSNKFKLGVIYTPCSLAMFLEVARCL